MKMGRGEGGYCEDLTYVWVTLSSETGWAIARSAMPSNTEEIVYSMICTPVVPLTLRTKRADQKILDTVKGTISLKKNANPVGTLHWKKFSSLPFVIRNCFGSGLFADALNQGGLDEALFDTGDLKRRFVDEMAPLFSVIVVHTKSFSEHNASFHLAMLNHSAKVNATFAHFIDDD
jgi:hypothetical protein